MANAINSLNFNDNIYTFTLPYGTCSTAAGTAAKTVDVDNFSLEKGARVLVKFTVTNSASSPTLNVENTGAKAIYYRGSAINAGVLAANRTYEFVYNGTQWDLIGDLDANTTYSAAGASLGLVKSGGDVTISNGVITVNDDSHNHVIDNIDGLQTALNDKASATTWSCNTTVGAWSRICYVSGSYASYLISISQSQNSQATSSTFIVNIGYGSATISQIAGSGYTGNNKPQIRLVKNTYTAVYIEWFNNFGYNGATTTAVSCEAIKLSNVGEVFTYTSYTATTSDAVVITTLQAQPTGIVSSKFYGALVGNADTATKATKDGSDNIITSTYETKTNASAKLTEAKNYADTAAITVKNDLLNGAGTAYDTLKELGVLIDENTDAIDALEIIAASKLPLNGGTMTGDIKFTNKGIIHIPGNTDQYLWKIYGSDDGKYGYRLQYNGTGAGNENTLVLIADNQEGDEVNAVTMKQDGTTTFAKRITASGGITGTLTGNATTATSATKATQDGSGNTITSTYLKLSGGTLTNTLSINGNNGTTGWVVRRSGSDNESVKLTVDDSNAIFTYTNDERANCFKFVLVNTDTESPAASGAAPNTSTVTMQGNASGSHVTADRFTGALIGNATSATKATQDGSGNNIVNTYATKATVNTNLAKSITGLSVSGQTITYTKGDGSTGTITTQDTNTTYTFNGAVSTIKDNNLTANRALISNGSGKVAVSGITSTELGYLDGVTSNIQTQLNDKAKITYKEYSSFGTASTGADGWYTLFTLSDSITGSALCLLKTYAHNSVIFTATKGYAANATLNVLDYNLSSNPSYACVKALRILANGQVQAQLHTGTVKISIHIISANGELTPVTSLVCDTTTTDSEICVSRTLSQGKIIADGFIGNLTGNATTATTAAKLGTSTVGSSSRPIYLDAGTPKAISSAIPITYGGTGATTAAGVLTNLGITATATELNKLDGITATTTELNYVDGVTSNIQTQLNAKQNTITGAATTVLGSNLTASRALISNSSGKIAVSNITSTELNYLDGVTSNIQTQLNGKLPLSGGTMTGNLTFATTKGIKYAAADNDTQLWQVYDSNGAYGYALQYNGSGSGNNNDLVLISDNQSGTKINAITMKQDGTTTFAKRITASGGITGDLIGNASSATKLATARTINGTNFDGSGNITTSSWGTARTLTIGDKGQSVNGSGNITWTLNDIGAAPDGLWKESYIDISIEGDADTYYPVIIKAGYDKGFPWARLSISRHYSWTAPNSWHNSTHKGGLTLALQWTGDSSWGGNDHYIKVERFHEQYCHMVGGLQLSTDGLIVWLRGGVANYRIHSDMGNKITASIKYSDYTSAGNVVYKVRSYNENTVKAEVTNLSITASVTELNYVDGVTSSIQTQLNGKLGASATAAAATKLTSSAGSATQPVYFSGGKPVACTYTLGKSVPSNAVFTDTTYSAATTSASGLMTADMVTKLNGIATGANKYILPNATSSVLGGVKIGSNITVSSGTISLTKGNVTAALGYTPPTTNTTYSIATASAAGLVKPISVITKPTINSTTTTSGRYYSVQMSSDGNMFVNVPWVNNTYSLSSFGITATAAELNHVDGVTSNIQTQLNNKVSNSMGYVNKALSWNSASYLQNVILLIPVPQSTNWVGFNFIDGRFFCWKTGGNVYDVIEINANCVYNSLRYHLESFGDNAAPVALCVCKYNGVSYYAIKCPYHANPYNNVTFIGRIRSEISGGTDTVNLPLQIPYYNENTGTVLNEEVKNSITDTLTTTYITSANGAPLHSKNGFVGNLTGNATTATNVAWSGVTSKPSYYDAKAIKSITRSGTTFTYTCMDGTTGTFTQQDNNTTYVAATQSAQGLMSAADKQKLDGIETGANNYTYTLPTASSTLGGVKTTSTVTSTSGLTACPIISGVVYYKDTNTTYSAAGSSLGLVKSGGDVTIASGVITVVDDSHNHTQLKGNTDNRAVATTPNDYNGIFKIAGLKTNSYIGSPSTDDYSGVIGFRQWGDNSGGKTHELAFNNSGLYMRQGASTSWEAWEKFITSGNYTSYTVKKDGTGASGTWGISITGNAASATKLATARTISISSTAGTTGTSFNGTANISLVIPTSLTNLNRLTFSTSDNTFSPTAQSIVLNGVSGSDDNAKAPGIGFHIGNKSWASLKFLPDGSFRFYNNGGTGYQPVYASTFYGSGSGLTSLNASNISSGTLAAARLATSGVTAGTYGPSANVNGANGNTISVPQITVDAYGRVTSVVNRTYTSVNSTYSLSSFGITATAAELNKLDGVTATASEINKLDGLTATTTELNYVDGVTSNIQTQLNNKYSANTSRTANTVLAAPNGSAGAATFRALVAADIPNLAASKITSGTLAIARGGTGQTTAKGANYSLLNNMNAVTSAVSDATQMVFKYNSPNATDGTIYYRTADYFWTYIKGKVDATYYKTVTKSGAIGTVTLANNTEYYYTGVTSLGINYPSGNFKCWLSVTTGSSAVTLSFPSGTKFIGASITSLAASTTYEISIKNKVVIIKEVG